MSGDEPRRSDYVLVPGPESAQIMIDALRSALAVAERECAELNDALDAMRMTADEVQAKQRQQRQAGAWAQAAAAVQQATDRSSA